MENSTRQILIGFSFKLLWNLLPVTPTTHPNAILAGDFLTDVTVLDRKTLFLRVLFLYERTVTELSLTEEFFPNQKSENMAKTWTLDLSEAEVLKHMCWAYGRCNTLNQVTI